MCSIMEELYDAFPPRRRGGPERDQAAKEYFQLCKKIEDVFGPDFTDRYSELNEQRLGYEGLADFSAGFRLGVRLMLEVFTPV